MSVVEKLPRIFKEPTGWIVILLVAGFFYMQWPTRVRTAPQPEPFVQTLENGFSLTWETQPEALSVEEGTQAWALTRKGMSFLLQTAPLQQDFEQLVKTVADRDQQTVAGAEQEPLIFGENTASYAFFDAESRIQEHRWYLLDEQWIKVSVLYKPSMESRVQRAKDFWAGVQSQM